MAQCLVEARKSLLKLVARMDGTLADSWHTSDQATMQVMLLTA